MEKNEIRFLEFFHHFFFVLQQTPICLSLNKQQRIRSYLLYIIFFNFKEIFSTPYTKVNLSFEKNQQQ